MSGHSWSLQVNMATTMPDVERGTAAEVCEALLGVIDEYLVAEGSYVSVTIYQHKPEEQA